MKTAATRRMRQTPHGLCEVERHPDGRVSLRGTQAAVLWMHWRIALALTPPSPEVPRG